VYIVIVGGGKVGFHLARALINEAQEVLVIEKDARKAERIMTVLGGTAIQGDGAEVATLQEAGVERADVVAAVTGHDEDNLIIAQVAKTRFNVPRTVVRVNNPRNEYVFSGLGIDTTVSATALILSVVQQEIPQHPFVHLLTLQEGHIEFVEAQVGQGSAAIGQPLRNIHLPADTAIPLVIRNGAPTVVHGDTVLEAGDKVIAVTTNDQEAALRSYLVADPTS